VMSWSVPEQIWAILFVSPREHEREMSDKLESHIHCGHSFPAPRRSNATLFLYSAKERKRSGDDNCSKFADLADITLKRSIKPIKSSKLEHRGDKYCVDCSLVDTCPQV
jgi:hypothetical protein